jgi:uncharacterized membrane-anchored protein YitT (DUF2179 family)
MNGQDVVNGIPILFVVIAVVEYLKKLGVDGKALTVASLLTGAVLGIAYQLLYLNLPPTPENVFTAVVYGLVLGLTASGVYDAQKSAAK